MRKRATRWPLGWNGSNWTIAGFNGRIAAW